MSSDARPAHVAWIVAAVLVFDQVVKVGIKLSFTLAEKVVWMPGVFDIQFIESRLDAFVEPVDRQEIAIGFGSRGETARDGNPEFAEIAYHFAQRSVLSADSLYIIHSKLGELDDVWFQTRLPCVPWQEVDNRSRRKNCATILVAATRRDC